MAGPGVLLRPPRHSIPHKAIPNDGMVGRGGGGWEFPANKPSPERVCGCTHSHVRLRGMQELGKEQERGEGEKKERGKEPGRKGGRKGAW